MRGCAEMRLSMSSSVQAKGYRGSGFGQRELERGEDGIFKGADN